MRLSIALPILVGAFLCGSFAVAGCYSDFDCGYWVFGFPMIFDIC